MVRSFIVYNLVVIELDEKIIILKAKDLNLILEKNLAMIIHLKNKHDRFYFILIKDYLIMFILIKFSRFNWNICFVKISNIEFRRLCVYRYTKERVSATCNDVNTKYIAASAIDSELEFAAIRCCWFNCAFLCVNV